MSKTSENSKVENVLVVKMRDGRVSLVSNETRTVYCNTKGRFIKTVSDGVVYLQAKNIALISVRRQPYSRMGGSIGQRWEYSEEDVSDLPGLVDNLLKEYM